MKIIDLAQGSPEWLAWRRTGLGGSDAPIIEELSPYRHPRDLWFEKRGTLPHPESRGRKSYILERGHQVEMIIRREFEQKTGVLMAPLCAEHRSRPFMLASLDGFDPGRYGILEAKLVGKRVLAEAKDRNKIPPHHFAQIQHQLEVADVEVCQWYGHTGSNDRAIVEIKRDRAYAARLISLEERFWERVQSGSPPQYPARMSRKDLMAALTAAAAFHDGGAARITAVAQVMYRKRAEDMSRDELREFLGCVAGER